MSDLETNLTIVAHAISASSAGVRARLVLKDDEGFYRAVLAVGDNCEDWDMAVENVVRKYESTFGIKAVNS